MKSEMNPRLHPDPLLRGAGMAVASVMLLPGNRAFLRRSTSRETEKDSPSRIEWERAGVRASHASPYSI